jgi:chaperone required for assembly of F1-ATPase
MPPADPAADRPKRFWREVAVREGEGGHLVGLDARAVRTPGGRVLALPTRSLAEQVAAEWAAVDQVLDYARMPATRLAFTAADKAKDARAGLAAEVARFAGADLVCYFAEAPTELVALQTRQWTPLLDWARDELGVALTRASGIIHAAQSPESLERVEALAAGLDDYALAGLAFAAGLFGSAVLALALQRGVLSGDEAFDLSRLDEAYQESLWGVDAEAAERTEGMRMEARMLERWFAALR